MADHCTGCGAVPATTFLNDQGPICDACLDEQISAAAGWPRLPAPPRPRTVTGPDGRAHRFRFRLWRTPGGISADAIEQGPDGDNQDGYTLSVHGDHDADPDALLDALDQRVRAETGRCYLDHDDLAGWQITGPHVAGRVSGDQDDPPDVIIDGRRIAWTDFGRMIASFDGWWFLLTFGDDDALTTTQFGDAPPK